MSDIFEWSFSDWIRETKDLMLYVLRRWYFLVLGCLIGAGVSYWKNKRIRPTYTATISFVLSTEPKGVAGGFAGIAAQLGLGMGANGTDDVFSGDNIIELFKSRKLIKQALLSTADSLNNQSLLNLIASTQYLAYKSILPFPSDLKKFNKDQMALFGQIVQSVSRSFTIFKKDEKLVFYYISATSENEMIAYYTAKCMLDQTSRFFIATKTSAATRGVQLLQKQADSLAIVLKNTYRSTASVTDRTYNINPSMMIQRSGNQLNQAKAIALGAAYTEVMRGLEVARINVQKETPLFSIIDEPDLPLVPQKVSIVRKSILMSIVGFIIMAIILSATHIYYRLLKPYLENAK